MPLSYQRPCVTKNISDDFKAHVKRGSNLPGLDYTCSVGSKVFATAIGRVVGVSDYANQSMGRYVILKHRDGRKSYYLHLSKLRVKVGDRVERGDTIALSGNTGTTTTGPHLHFSIKNVLGRCVDPAIILSKFRPPKGVAVKVIPE